MIETRYDLAMNRIRMMKEEDSVKGSYRDFFSRMASFVLLLDQTMTEITSGACDRMAMEELRERNQLLYSDILPGAYGKSYGNPAYATETLGREMGQLLCFLYSELRGGIPFAFEGKKEYLVILAELLIEVYNRFEEDEEPKRESVQQILYWYVSDYLDVFSADYIRSQIDPQQAFISDWIEKSDLQDLRYLYRTGEYVSEDQIRTAEHMNMLPDETLQVMTDVYTEGYRKGFINTGRDIRKKNTVNIRYELGFERMIRKAVSNFRKMGLEPVIYRAGSLVSIRRGYTKTGFYGGIANKQYDYDHKDDLGLFLDKQFVERKLSVLLNTFEKNKELARGMGGPACVETFGESPFSPVYKESAVHMSPEQAELARDSDSRASRITNRFIPGDERSYTIIAYPMPAIGEKYKEIFDEVIRINTLDAALYEKIQQTLIDELDRGAYVHVKGKEGNDTDLKIRLAELLDPDRETLFENCVADVNIPVGEVFTSPRLEGTEGILHVKKVFLEDLRYDDLKITFEDGMIVDYTCANFEDEEKNREYIRENILHKHESIPLGEFAIGTNTTAYQAAGRFHIFDRMPILIAEKMGPHFAVGDTCYSWSEEIKVFNPNGKEIIAKDNSCSCKRKTDISRAYFQCHTDITLPYAELGSITVVTKTGEETDLLRDGRFVLPGTEELNRPLDEC